ncbi:hypothetical protein BDZ45DRAFT_768619, partial [Acephala macrosclerotiorum]
QRETLAGTGGCLEVHTGQQFTPDATRVLCSVCLSLSNSKTFNMASIEADSQSEVRTSVPETSRRTASTIYDTRTGSATLCAFSESPFPPEPSHFHGHQTVSMTTPTFHNRSYTPSNVPRYKRSATVGSINTQRLGRIDVFGRKIISITDFPGRP